MKKRIIVAALSLLLVVLTLSGGVVGYIYVSYDNAVQDPGKVFNNTEDELDEETDKRDFVEINPDGSEVKTTKFYNKDLVNVLVLGYDHEKARENEKYAGAFRSDTMILVSINLKTKKASMLTIPRDTRAMVQKLNKDGSVKSQDWDKIGHAMVWSGGKKANGYKNAMQAVSTLLGGIPVDYFGAIEMDGFLKLVDDINGVPVDVEVDIPVAGVKKGYQVLKGKKALAYVQQRKIPGTGNSDIERTQRQKKFIMAFLEKAKTLGAVKIASMIPSILSYTDTNLKLDEVMALANIFQEMDLSQIKSYTIEGHGQMIGKLDYWIPDKEKLDQVINEMFYIHSDEN